MDTHELKMAMGQQMMAASDAVSDEDFQDKFLALNNALDALRTHLEASEMDSKTVQGMLMGLIAPLVYRDRAE